MRVCITQMPFTRNALLLLLGLLAALSATTTFSQSVPMVTITSGTTHPTNDPFDVTITFSTGVTGFQASEVSITNGTPAASFKSSTADAYTITITPDANFEGDLTVEVPADAADGVGNAPARQTFAVDTKAPELLFAAVVSTRVTLTYDEDLDANSMPTMTSFVVTSRRDARFEYIWSVDNSEPFVGDFNGDGKADIGYWSSSENKWYIRYGDGTGVFDNETSYDWTVDASSLVFVADFDGDGYDDLGVRNPSTSNWYIRYGNGMGSFSDETVYDWSANPDSLPFAADFNGDGYGDLGVRNPTSRNWYIRYGNGMGSFSDETVYDWSANSDSLPFAADFNGDGYGDLGVRDPTSRNWYIRYGNGMGSFSDETRGIWSAPEGRSFAGDFSGDGSADVAVVVLSSGLWTVRYGDDTGQFVEPLVVQTHLVDTVLIDGPVVTLTLSTPVPADADVDLDYTTPESGKLQDGLGNAAADLTDRAVDKPTVAITSGTTHPTNDPFDVTITFSTGVTGFQASEVSITNGTPAASFKSSTADAYTITITPDANFEGDLTVEVPADAADGVGNAPARQTFAVDTKAPELLFAAVVSTRVTLTYDEDLDANSMPTMASFVVTSRRDARFEYIWSVDNSEPFVGDFNGDGKADIGYWSSSENKWYIRYGDGTGVFDNETSYDWTVDASSLVFVADFDGDGYDDLGVRNPSTSNWYIRYGNGMGSFSDETVYDWSANPDSLPFAADFNGDGYGDLGVRNPTSRNWYIRYGNGMGSFSDETVYDWSANSDSLPFAADFNGDGYGDLGVRDPTSRNWYIRYGNGMGSFSDETRGIWSAPEGRSFAGDFSGDGSADVAVVVLSSGLWTVRYGDDTGQFVEPFVVQTHLVDTVLIDGPVVTLTLSTPVPADADVDLDYTTPESGKLQDGLGNAAADLTDRAVDKKPTVAITSGTTHPTNDPFDVTITFSTGVTGFQASEVSITNGTPAASFKSSTADAYTITITPGANFEGDLTVEVPADAADGVGNAPARQTFAVDTKAPALSSAVVVGNVLTLTYDENLDSGSVPDASAFAVRAGQTGSLVAVSLANTNPVAVSGAAVTLTLARAVATTDAVTVSYTVPGLNPIQDEPGNDAAALTDGVVSTKLRVTIASAATHPTKDAFDVTITFSTDVTGFQTTEVEVTNGTPAASFKSSTADAYTITITPNANFDGDVTVEVAADAATASGVGNAQASRTFAVDTKAPSLSSVSVSGNVFTLRYDETLDMRSTPALTTFTVNSDAGQTVTVTDVTVTGSTVLLTLSRAVTNAESVRVSYTVPATGSKIQDDLGNAAASFSEKAPLGQFESPCNYHWPISKPLTGDFDGDGNEDLAAFGVSGEGGIYVVRYGDRDLDCQFTDQTQYTWSGSLDGHDTAFNGMYPFAGDFNGDGIADIGIVFEKDGWGARWHIRYGDGNGQFSGQTLYEWYGSDLFAQPFVADFNGDGNADIGLWTPGMDEDYLNTQPHWENWGGGGAGNWHIRYGDGSGGFSGQTQYKWVVDLEARPIAGDFNGDGFGDIGVWTPEGEWVIRRGDGMGQFDHETSFTWGGGPNDPSEDNKRPIVGDFNSDGYSDIGYFKVDDGRWYLRRHHATLETGRTTGTLPSPQSVGAIDAVTLTVGRAAWREDVAEYFSHAESYLATSSDSNIARVRVTGSLVTIMPVAAGSVTVTVSGGNDDSTTDATQIIAVTVEADAIVSEPLLDRKLPEYDVEWTSRGSNRASQGMPIGNGTQSALVWAGSDRDLYLLLGANDFLSENVYLNHPGRIRIRYSGTPFDSNFRQKLDLKNAEIVVTAGTDPKIRTRIWADANAPVIHIESQRTEGSADYSMEVTFESLRTEERDHNHGGFTDFKRGHPYDTVQRADETETEGDVVWWYQRNAQSYFDEILEHQQLDASRYSDILTGRTYGGRLEGNGFTASGTTVSKTGNSHRVAVTLHSEVVNSVLDWKQRVDKLHVPVTTDIETRRVAHRTWWKNFWNRSYIFVSGSAGADTAVVEQAHNAGRNYMLTRYRHACAARTPGIPIRFNGSIFNVGTASDPDFRKRSSLHGFNQRFVPWSMLPSGDFDLMQPHFDLYANSLRMAKDRVSAWWGPETRGAMWGEVNGVFGHVATSVYGWRRVGNSDHRTIDQLLQPGSPILNVYTRHLYTSNIELVAMLLDYYEYTQDASFAKRRLLPIAEGVLNFYFTRWEIVGGELDLRNLNSGENDRNVDNPTADVSGLHRVLAGLLALPQDLTSASQRADWTTKKGQVPAIAIDDDKFKTGADLPTAATNVDSDAGPPFGPKRAATIENNNQNLYPIFPFRLYGFGDTDTRLQIATNSYLNRYGVGVNLSYYAAWIHDGTHAAYLGLHEQALTYLGRTLLAPVDTADRWRFPTFSDGRPDEDPSVERPAIGKITLQAMLMHPSLAANDTIHLLNAWPSNWDVQFKLHAPKKTVVRGSRAGDRIAYTVTPSSRASDVMVRGSLTTNERLPLSVAAVTSDNTIDDAEKMAGFNITGSTGSLEDATVTVTLGGTTVGSTTSASNGAWSMAVPADATYLIGTSVALTVVASKPGYLDATPVKRTLILSLDTMAPALSSAAVSGNTLTLTYDEVLDAASVPDATAFTVQAGPAGSLVEVSLAGTNPVTVTGATVTLRLLSAVSEGAVVRVSYTAPETGPLRDWVGNEAAALTNRAVQNDTAAPTATITSAATHPTKDPFDVTITFSTGVTGFEAGEVEVTNGTAAGSFKSATATDYTITITPHDDHDGNVTVAVAADAATANGVGNAAASGTFAVDTKGPSFESAAVTGNRLVMTYHEAPDERSAPAPGQFSVTSDLDPGLTVTGVVLSGATVTLTLSSAVSEGAMVRVSYAVPAGDAPKLQDALGNAAALLRDESVTNDTATLTVTIENAGTTFPTGDSFGVTLTFSEDVIDFDVDDVEVTNGSASGFSGSGRVYTMRVTPDEDYEGDMTVTVPADAARTEHGVDNEAASEVYEVDTKAPLLRTAVVTGNRLVLTYDEVLEANEVPPSSFTVTVGGEAVPLAATDPVAVYSQRVTLRLAAAVGEGDVVRVNVTPPDNDYWLVDVRGNAVKALTNRAVQNDTAAPTATITSAATHPTNDPFDVTITFSAPVTDFAQGDINVTNGTLLDFVGSEKTYIFAVTPALNFEGEVTVEVAADVATDANGVGNAAASGTFAVDTRAPALSSAAVTGSRLVLSYDEELDAASVPVAGAFTVEVWPDAANLSRVTLSGTNPVTVSEETVTVRLSSAVTPGAVVRLSYTAPTSGPLRDGVGNKAVNLLNAPVSNETAAPRVTITSGEIFPTRDPFEVTLAFSEDVTGFAADDVRIIEGTASNFSGTGTNYTVRVTPGPGFEGEVTVEVAADVATDANGVGNAAASGTFAVDTKGPSFESAAVTGNRLVMTYHEAPDERSAPAPGQFSVTSDLDPGLTVTGVVLSGATVTLTLSSAVSEGAVVRVSYAVPAGDAPKLQDALGNAAASLRDELVTNDTVALTVEITSGAEHPTKDAFEVTLAFSEDVTGFEAGEVEVTNGTAAGSFKSATATDYTITITPHDDHDGNVTVSVPADAAQSRFGVGNEEASGAFAVDTKGPALESAAVTGNRLVLSYDEELDADSVPAGSEYRVTVGGDTVSLSGTDPVTVSGATVTLRLSSAVSEGAVVRASYAAPSNDPVRDALGNAAEDFAGRTVANDTTTPTVEITSGAEHPTKDAFEVTLAFSEDVTGFAAGEVAVMNGTAAGFYGSGKTYMFTVTAALDFEGEVTVEVAADVATDANGVGNAAASGTFAVDTKGPSFESAAVTGNRLVMTYHEAPDERSAPAPGQFSVTSDLDPGLTVTGVVLSGATVTLTLSSAVSEGAMVRVSYAVPAGDAPKLQDALGNAAALLRDESVTNDTATLTVTIENAGTTFPTGDSFGVTLTFSEDVIDFDVDDVEVTNGSASGFSGSGRVYTMRVTPDEDYEGDMTVTVPADAARTEHGVDNEAASEVYEVDTKAPLLRTAVVTGNRLVLTYDEVLEANEVPPSSFTVITSAATHPTKDAFTVTITFSASVADFVSTDITVTNGTAADFSGAGTTYTITLTPAEDHDGDVTVTVPADAATVNGVGNAQASETFAVDTRAPALSRAAVSGNTLTLTYNETLDALDFEGEVTVEVAADVATDANGVGNAAASGTFAVDTKGPSFESAAVTGNRLVMTYHEAPDERSAPAPGQFSVTSDLDPGLTVTGVVLSGATVTLTLSSAVSEGAMVRVSYAVPAGDAPKLQDALGNAAALLRDESVTNDTATLTVTIENAGTTFPTGDSFGVTLTFSRRTPRRSRSWPARRAARPR